jgi:uncharacterized membrane protein YfcA
VALGTVAALAVAFGSKVVARLSTTTLRTAMAVVLVGLATWSAFEAAGI